MPSSDVGRLRDQMLTVGDRLNAELARELQLDNAPRADLRNCRRTVDALAGEYLDAIARYREAMYDSCTDSLWSRSPISSQ